MTQKTLADRIGIREATLSRYEHNLRINRWIYLIRIADALQTSVDYLLGRTDIMSPVDTVFTYQENEEEKLLVFGAYDSLDEHKRGLLMERALSLYSLKERGGS
jgi:transcriptional regulator with XRE-family HTH domain